jgi:ferric-dicitrate binding protein FerR (iron transport regulator)
MSGERPSESDLTHLLKLAGPRPAVPDDARARVQDAVRAHWGTGLRRRRRRRATAALVVVAAGAAGALLTTRHRPPLPPPAVVAVVDRVTGPGVRDGASLLGAGASVRAGAWLETSGSGRAALRLVGEASLRLDSGTRVQLLSASVVRLDHGAVYVDSRGVTVHPVQVLTPEGRLREAGTQFQARADARGLDVRVREGGVFFVGPAGRHHAPAGSRLEIAAGGARRSETAGHGPNWAWAEETAPEFALEGQTAAVFLNWAARETGRQVRYRDAWTRRAAERTLLHGSTSGLTPSQALEAVLPPSGLRARHEGGTLSIARSRE